MDDAGGSGDEGSLGAFVSAPCGPLSPGSARVERRCRQVLDAAAVCFRRHGFHSTSMAQIAGEAGMSVGHIYRYFDNKEAVIAAIAEEDLQLAREKFTRMLDDPAGPSVAMVAHVDEGVRRMLDPAEAALFMEVMAEASRNPTVAASVHRHYTEVRAYIDQLFALGETGPTSCPRSDKVELMMLMFEGLRVRAIQDPGADVEAMIGAIETFVSELWTSTT